MVRNYIRWMKNQEKKNSFFVDEIPSGPCSAGRAVQL